MSAPGADLFPFTEPLRATEAGGAWLALDTSTLVAGVALLVAGDTPRLRELELPAKVVPSEALFAAILELLATEKVAARDLTGIVVGLGPGSFTGLRVGLASAKGLALGSGCRLYGTSSLALAASGRATGLRVVVRDARRAQAYVGVYEATQGAGVATELIAPVALPLAGLGERLEAMLLPLKAARGEAGGPIPVEVIGDFAGVLARELTAAREGAQGPMRAAYGLLREQARLIAQASDDVWALSPTYLQAMLPPQGDAR